MRRKIRIELHLVQVKKETIPWRELCFGENVSAATNADAWHIVQWVKSFESEIGVQIDLRNA